MLRSSRLFQLLSTRNCSYDMAENKIIAVCQMTVTNNKEQNLESFQRLVTKAADNGAKVAFFPEAADYLAENPVQSYELSEPLDGPLMAIYKTFAKENNIWISIGGFHERVSAVDSTSNKMSNSHVLISDMGQISEVYRKLHLFDVSIPEKNINLKESSYVVKGEYLVPPVKTPVGDVGMSICYDLRFPETSTLLRKLGASILTFPSAFTTTTGEAHWEVLLRARAIENQCYVVAAAQYGQHNANRKSHGHSVIIDPWGEIVAECKRFVEGESLTDESVAFATINEDYMNKVRQEMPVFEHRRNDLYSLCSVPLGVSSIDGAEYKFAHITIPSATVFYRSKYCFAFTNIRCVVPGHVLVTSINGANRLEDLSHEEVADFFNTVVKVQKAVEKAYSADSSTVCVQDGKNAGQTIPQVHCHILPRRVDDFENNDDIYAELARHDKEPRPLRSIEEQVEEAVALRMLLTS